MKRLLLSGALLAALMSSASAQTNKEDLKNPPDDQSPYAETSATVGGKTIWIAYHAPSVRNRKIFGGADALQPDNSVWRLGANYATILHTDADLDFNGVNVPKGEYTLYIDLDKGTWKLIVNKTLLQGSRHIWGITGAGATTNNPATELGRVPLTMGKPASLAETLKITLSDSGRNRGRLLIEFEHVTAAAQFTVK